MSGFVTLPGAPSTVWSDRSFVVDGQDWLDEPVTIAAGQNFTGAVVTFTDRPTELAGTITDAQGRPATDLFVLAFPVDRRQWVSGSRRIAQTRSATNGLFRHTSLPPGEYFLCALTDISPETDIADPTFLEQLLPASVKVVLRDGEKKVQDLRTGRR